MDWKTFFLTFGLIFLAELGDKTQLGVIGLVTKSNSPWMVLSGAIAALVTSTLLAVLLGGALVKALPLKYLHTVSGLIFVIVGILIIIGSYK